MTRPSPLTEIGLSSSSLGESSGASGLVRFYGQWEPFHRRQSNTEGLLVYKIENRHRIAEITPFDLGFEAGSITPTGTFFNEFDFGLTNLYWKQYLFDRDFALAIGKIDVTDFIDVYALMNPLTHFINLSFSTNPTIAAPNPGLGAAVGACSERMPIFRPESPTPMASRISAPAP